MSVFGDLTHTMKRGLLFVYGPAELDTARDPVQNVDQEHGGRAKTGA